MFSAGRGLAWALLCILIFQPENGSCAYRLAQNFGGWSQLDGLDEGDIHEFTPIAGEPAKEPADSSLPVSRGATRPAFHPSQHVVDKLLLLTSYQRAGLARELSNASEKEGLSVALLTLRKPPGISIDAFAQELARAWKDSEMFGMIMCLTSETGNLQRDLFIVPGENAETLAGGEAVNEAMAHVKASALEAQTVPEALFRASREMLSQYRLLRNRVQAEQERARLAGESEAGRSGAAAGGQPGGGSSPLRPNPISLRLIFALGAILGLLLVPLFLVLRHARNRALYLPQTEIDFRLCSPYSGGNNIRLDFKNTP